MKQRSAVCESISGMLVGGCAGCLSFLALKVSIASSSYGNPVQLLPQNNSTDSKGKGKGCQFV